MELKVEGLDNYRVVSKALRPYRNLIAVQELSKDGEPTGSVWVEPYDTIRGNERELASRFQKRLDKEKRVVIVQSKPVDPVEFTDAVVECAQETIKRLIDSVLESSSNRAATRVEERMEAVRNNVQATPKQVIVAQSVADMSEKILRIIHPVLKRVFEEACRVEKESWWRRLRRLITRGK